MSTAAVSSNPYILPIDSAIATRAAAAAAAIVSGVVFTDRAADVGASSMAGPILFTGGWAGLAAVLSAYNPNKNVNGSSGTVERAELMTRLRSVGLPAVAVWASAIYAQRQMHGAVRGHEGASPMRGMILFAIAWNVFALSLARANASASNRKRWLRSQQTQFSVAGAWMVIGSMMMLMRDRRLGSAPGCTHHTYSLGLPLFTAGWMSIITAASLRN